MSKHDRSLKRRLAQQKQMTAKQVAAAMNAASQSLDRQIQEIAALKRILISERAQVIYYTDKYQKFVQHECLDLVAKGFLELSEAEQTVYIKQAVQELSDAQGLVPHDPDAETTRQQAEQMGGKIILQ